MRTDWTFALVLVLCLVPGRLAINAQSQQRALLPVTASGGPRLALVIGNQAYKTGALTNPDNDARDMAVALRQFGFDVTLGSDLSQQRMEETIEKFLGKVNPGAVVVFYYSGHGIQVQDQNYLVPIDFEAATAVEAKYHSYPVNQLLDRLQEQGAALEIVILDACRNNPFRNLRSVGGGLAAMDTGKGTYIAFATAPGRTADDNPNGRNGLFTGELLAELKTGDGTLDQIFNHVRARVTERSGGAQTPWSVSSVVGDYYFRTSNGSAAPPSGVVNAPSADTQLEAEVELWQSIKDSGQAALFEDYLRQYPDGRFASVAKARIAELKPPPAEANAARPSAPAAPTPRGDLPSSASGPQWRRYNYSADGFSADFPIAPGVTKKTITTDSGPVDMRQYLAEDGSTALMIAVSDYGQAGQGRDPDNLMKGAQDGTVKAIGGRLKSSGKIALGGHPGTAFEAESKALRYSARLYFVGTILYQVVVVAPAKDTYTGTERFLDSFQLTAPSQN